MTTLLNNSEALLNKKHTSSSKPHYYKGGNGSTGSSSCEMTEEEFKTRYLATKPKMRNMFQQLGSKIAASRKAVGQQSGRTSAQILQKLVSPPLSIEK